MRTRVSFFHSRDSRREWESRLRHFLQEISSYFFTCLWIYIFKNNCHYHQQHHHHPLHKGKSEDLSSLQTRAHCFVLWDMCVCVMHCLDAVQCHFSSPKFFTQKTLQFSKQCYKPDKAACISTRVCTCLSFAISCRRSLVYFSSLNCISEQCALILKTHTKRFVRHSLRDSNCTFCCSWDQSPVSEEDCRKQPCHILHSVLISENKTNALLSQKCSVKHYTVLHSALLKAVICR